MAPANVRRVAGQGVSYRVGGARLTGRYRISENSYQIESESDVTGSTLESEWQCICNLFHQANLEDLCRAG